MGCGGSKLDDLEAVILCRERSTLLAEVIKYRYDLADAHLAYSKSLNLVGDSLYHFLDGFWTMPSISPAIQLPAQRKGEENDVNANVNSEHRHSSSGHIDFKSDSSELGDEDDEDEIHLHSDSDSPIEHHLHHHQGLGGPILNYAKNQPPSPSVTYFVRGGGAEASSSSGYDPYSVLNYAKNQPPNPSVSYFVGGGEGEASSSSGYNPYPYYGNSYPTQNANFYPYSNYGYGGIGGGYFGGSSSPPVTMRENLGSPPPKETPPPPPPPPPSVSTWDFLNPFQNYESYYENYTPSRSSKDVREEEGIPDLEDEENVVVKEAYGYDDKKKNKMGDSASSSPESSKEDKVSEIEEEPAQLKKNLVDAGPSEGNVVEKNVVVNVVKEPVAPLKRYNDIPEVVKEVRVQFDRASESAVELSKMLEVGKQPYHQRNSVYKVSSRMICGVSSLTSSEDEVLVFEDDKAMDSGNLSSTLQRLYIWEKKLYDEVKAEEKMRVMHDKKRRELRRLDERGAEAYKLDSTLAVVRKLSTKIRIAIQVVDSISNKISKLRDDDLWPQICELIHGLMRMWNVMLQCHRTQCRALSEVDSFASGGNISDAHMEITKKLELELLEWLSSFSAWINAQKSYVWALNNWLLKGLRYVEEVTPDGIAPFSPGRLGAPPIFVICHQWAQTMERISEKEVIDAMGVFASNVLSLWEKHNFQQRQRLMANKDMDRTLRIMEREEQEMRRAVETQNKKLILVSGHNANISVNNEASNLQGDLRQIFEAMENFSASTLKAYEELHMRVEEERLARENGRVT